MKFYFGLFFFFFLTMRSIGAVKLLPGFKYEPLIKGELSEPLDLKFSPDGFLWVTSRRGEIWIYSPKTKTNYRMAKLEVDFSGERGLHGIEFDPNYLENSIIYLYYAQQDDEDHFNLVTKWKVKKIEGKFALGDKPLQVLLRIPSEENGFHEGGAMEYNRKDGKLYVTVGDNHRSPETDKFFNDPKNRPQNVNDLRGKVLRLNLDGTIPKDNPFVEKADHRPEIYTYGHRNPYSISIDQPSGKVYVGEVGYDLEKSFEEINLLQSGGNYGWPRCQGKNRGTFGGPCPLRGAIDPFITYQRYSVGASITIGSIFHQASSPTLTNYPFQNGLFIADFARKWIRFANLDPATNEFKKMTSFAAGLGGGPLAVRIGPDGALYFTEYSGWFEKGKSDQVSRISYSGWTTPDSKSGKTGKFDVLPWLEEGIAFKNSLPCALKITFTAHGEWSYAPSEPKNSPAGNSRHLSATDNYLLPRAPEGGLIIRRTNGAYQFVGKEKEISLEPQESIAFLINDAKPDVGGLTFEDNEGNMEIQWKHTGCQ